MKVKMDTAVFQAHQRKKMEAESIDNRDFKLAEKFYKIERQIDGLLYKES